MAIVADTSALVAIFRNEPNSDDLLERLASADRALVPASCLAEASLLRRLGQTFFPWLEQTVSSDSFEIVPITREAARAAVRAAKLYGKGSGHPAQLNFGDCLSFGVASSLDRPLLFAGGDFALTPIHSATSTGSS